MVTVTVHLNQGVPLEGFPRTGTVSVGIELEVPA